ncbi:MAG: hypothetical protein N2039_15165 [Gemmataceae bacterium]|nr:hypothetical protein [Gemmataceae bacterium]
MVPHTARMNRVLLWLLLTIAAAGSAGILLARRGAEERASNVAPAVAAILPDTFDEFTQRHLPAWKGEKPELAILVTGQQHNYEAPCGCTEPQYGGLERRYNFITQLRSYGIPTVALDLGDMYASGRIVEQSRLKYRVSMKALALMGYDAINVGPNEFHYPLIDALAETILNAKVPYQILAANIPNKDDYPGEDGSMLKDFRVIHPRGTKVRVGVVGTLGKSVVDAIVKRNSTAPFARNIDAIPAALRALQAERPDVKVLLYQGSSDEARVLAQQLDEFDVIVCRSEESEPRTMELVPPARGQTKRPKARIVYVGHKGRYIGALGVFRTASGEWDLRWEPVRLSPELKTPPEKQEQHPIVQLLEDYTRKLKDEDFVGKIIPAQHPVQARFNGKLVRYVGSEACKDCHQAEYESWDESRHAGAYPTLWEHPKSKPPHNREFDPECVICHTVGYGYMTGFRDNKSGYTDVEKSKHLLGVGCETCHGPGGLHVERPNDKEIALALSPWKEQPDDYLTPLAIKDNKSPEEQKQVSTREQTVADRVFRMCFQCHDTDNDHNFHLGKWLSIAHGKGPTVKKKK